MICSLVLFSILSTVYAQTDDSITSSSSDSDSIEQLHDQVSRGDPNAAALDGSCFADSSMKLSDESFLNNLVVNSSQDVVHRGERDFSVNLIKALFAKYTNQRIEENIFISPSSIFQTLLLAFFGAEGETRRELAEGLGVASLGRPDVLKAYMMDQVYQAVRERTPKLGYEFRQANKLYFERSLELNKCLQLALYNQIESTDFAGNAEAARENINNWVDKMTKGNIQNLIPAGYVDSDTKAAIVNAAYFKGEWQSQFKPSNTKAGNFYVTRDQIRIVKFMQQKGSFNYYTSEQLQAHIVELPYQGNVSMIVILPPFTDNGLHETVARLTPDTLQGVMQELQSNFFKMEKLDVKLPKFEVSGSLELSQTLGQLNISSIFNGATSNFTGFIDRARIPLAEQNVVKFQKAVHKSFINVNEEGSEAAAATALIGFRSARPLFPTEFKADHPFLYLIYDKPTNSILFFGVYQYPPQP